MHDVSSHPSLSQLDGYLLGRLTDADTDKVERHLAECAQCSTLAVELEPRDSLVELLAAAGKVTLDQCVSTRGTMHTMHSCEVSTSICGSVVDESGAGKSGQDDQDDHDEPVPPPLRNHCRYRVIRMLGRGGMGCVWLAEHLVLGRPVALKMLRGDWTLKTSTVERFDREIRAAAKLNHPNIATVHDAEQIGDSHFLVMEYVEGETLAEIVSRGPLSVLDACRAIRDAAKGLAHAHAARLIHRDVKPGNMIRTPSGRVKILDFGLVVSPEEASMLTGPNLVMGTPDYIAPEQAEDPRAADERSDLYGLGCTFYHLLTGQVPFPVASIVKKIDAHRQQVVVIPNVVPQPVAAILYRMLEKSPDARIQSATDVVDLLERFCTGDWTPQSSSMADPGENRTTLPSRRGNNHGWRWLMVAMLPLALIFGSGAVFRILTDRGELIIKALDEDVDVVVRQGGRIVTIIDTRSQQRMTLNSGRYALELDGAPSDLQLDIKEISLTRGDKVIATIRRVDKVAPTRVEKTATDETRPQTVFRQRLTGHSAVVRTVMFSPDSVQLFSVSNDGTARVWDVASGEMKGIFDHRDSSKAPLRIAGGAIVDDGATLITSQDDRLRIWDVSTRQEKIPGFEAVSSGSLQLIDASPDGSLIAAGSDEGVVRVWNIADRQMILESAGPNDHPVYSVKWLVDRKELLVDDGANMSLVDVANGNRRILDENEGGYMNVTVSPDGKLLAGVMWSTRVTVIDRESARIVSDFVSGGARLCFLPDGRLVTASPNRITDLWDAEGRVRLVTLYGGAAAGAPLAVSHDGKLIATGGEDNSILIWDVPEITSIDP